MKLIKNNNQLLGILDKVNNLSFVPTMGALHRGHLSLIQKASNMNGKIMVSIFVNPKQFNSKNDFLKYPRNLKKDLNMLNKSKVDYVFIPSYKNMFNFKPKNSIYIHNFSKKLCGKFRPGHFKGVLNIVNRFLDLIKPKRLFLGDKDYQQFFLIKAHIKKNKINTIVHNCKTIRDKYGLAYSSRLKNLTRAELNTARSCINFLKKNKKYLKIKKTRNKYLKNFKLNLIKNGVSKIDYLEVLDKKNFKEPKNKKNITLFTAFHIGRVRIIDNF